MNTDMIRFLKIKIITAKRKRAVLQAKLKEQEAKLEYLIAELNKIKSK